MSIASLSCRTLVLVKHAQPVMDPSVPPREWQLGPEGEAQSRELADRLRRFLPFTLVSSSEPKATRTAAIVGEALSVAASVADGLQEYDRPAMAIVPRDEHERVNARVFESRRRAVLGRESADAALDRFAAAIERSALASPPNHNLVVIAHGTVIALFVERETGRSAFELWKALRCAEFIPLEV